MKKLFLEKNVFDAYTMYPDSWYKVLKAVQSMNICGHDYKYILFNGDIYVLNKYNGKEMDGLKVFKYDMFEIVKEFPTGYIDEDASKLEEWMYCFENQDQIAVFEQAFSTISHKKLTEVSKKDIVVAFISMNMDFEKKVVSNFVEKMTKNIHEKYLDEILPSIKYFTPSLQQQCKNVLSGAKIDMLLKHISFLICLQKETGRSYDYCACKIKRMIIDECI